MEFLKKLFNFSDTISGVDFLIRWVSSIIIQWPGGFLIGYGIASGIMGLTMLGVLIACVGIVLQFSTLRKRARALFTDNNDLHFYIVYLILSIIQGFTNDMELIISIPINILVLIVFSIALFKNSGISPDSHLG